MKRILLLLVVLEMISLTLPLRNSDAQAPDATVKITEKSLAAGIGYSWGSGILTYQGKEYPFTISGLSAGDIGFNVAELSGEVSNLKNLEGFNGNYTSFAAGLTIAGGGSGATMRNQNGVIMKVVATTQGLTLKLGVEGMKVELTK